MYEAFFGLKEPPFQLTPNPRFLFLTAAHREALATLRYGLTSSLGITLLLGEAGTGKTTLLSAALLAERRPKDRIAVISNPTLAPAEFYEILADRFELPGTAGSKAKFLLTFERDLLDWHKAGGLTAMVIDEAQSLTHALFEEVRLLANLETATAKLVNVVLVGQPELAERLNDPSLRQLKQRIILRAELAPLGLKSTASYIAARLRVAERRRPTSSRKTPWAPSTRPPGASRGSSAWCARTRCSRVTRRRRSPSTRPSSSTSAATWTCRRPPRPTCGGRAAAPGGGSEEAPAHW